MPLECMLFLALEWDRASYHVLPFLPRSEIGVRFCHRIKLGATDEDVLVWALHVSDLRHGRRPIAD